MKARADIGFVQLGWKPLRGDAPGRDGPVEFRVIAPWCPDCEDWGESLAQGLPADGRPVWLVGEFCSEESLLAYAGRYWPAHLPILLGTTDKTEVSRVEAPFQQVRSAFQDNRKWGVPSVIGGHLVNGRLLVENLFDPSA